MRSIPVMRRSWTGKPHWRNHLPRGCAADTTQHNRRQPQITACIGLAAFIGWVCGMALAWHFLILHVVEFILLSLGVAPVGLPQFDLAQMDTILFGMLGLGTLRTAEKAAGRA